MHIDNLDFILRSGKLTAPTHPNRDSNYYSIGSSTLTRSRGEVIVPVAPNGTIKDYVSFYFGHRSPMLYNIVNGYQEVEQVSQTEIIYLISTVNRVISSGAQFVFTDGHSKHKLSQFYSSAESLHEVDFSMAYEKNWRDTENDTDRKRKKQAEFLVHNEMPLECLAGIAVYNESTKTRVISILEKCGSELTVKIKPEFYY